MGFGIPPIRGSSDFLQQIFRLRIIRIKFYSGLQVFYGVCHIPLSVKRDGQVVMGFWVFRINGNGSLIMINGVIYLIPIKVKPGKVVVGRFKIRIYPQGLS